MVFISFAICMYSLAEDHKRHEPNRNGISTYKRREPPQNQQPIHLVDVY